MILYPAIDILDGKVVRLTQGDYDRVTVYSTDPVAQAADFAAQGATWIHVVDLDGAREGAPVNAPVIKRIAEETGIHIEVGGGIRSMSIAGAYHDAGVERIVLGTALVKDPGFSQRAIEWFGKAIVAGIDARDGSVATEGWLEVSEIPAVQLASHYRDLGIGDVVYTDIARDGMQAGIDARAYADFAEKTGMAVSASGGIATLDDLRALAGTGKVAGAIIGRALYEGAFTLSEALEAVAAAEEGGPC